jgi:hypothetical protein
MPIFVLLLFGVGDEFPRKAHVFGDPDAADTG